MSHCCTSQTQRPPHTWVRLCHCCTHTTCCTSVLQRHHLHCHHRLWQMGSPSCCGCIHCWVWIKQRRTWRSTCRCRRSSCLAHRWVRVRSQLLEPRRHWTGGVNCFRGICSPTNE